MASYGKPVSIAFFIYCTIIQVHSNYFFINGDKTFFYVTIIDINYK